MARTPEEQNLLQYRHAAELQQRVEHAVSRLEHRGFDGVMVFCNSLASCIDIDRLKQQTTLRIVTPLDVYTTLPDTWERIFLITANGHTLADIETLLVAKNRCMEVTGFSNLAFVKIIEQKPADQAFEDFPFADLVALAELQNNQAIVLGCTHLTSVFSRIRAISRLPVIDTGTVMAEMIRTSCAD